MASIPNVYFRSDDQLLKARSFKRFKALKYEEMYLCEYETLENMVTRLPSLPGSPNPICPIIGVRSTLCELARRIGGVKTGMKRIPDLASQFYRGLKGA